MEAPLDHTIDFHPKHEWISVFNPVVGGPRRRYMNYLDHLNHAAKRYKPDASLPTVSMETNLERNALIPLDQDVVDMVAEGSSPGYGENESTTVPPVPFVLHLGNENNIFFRGNNSPRSSIDSGNFSNGDVAEASSLSERAQDSYLSESNEDYSSSIDEVSLRALFCESQEEPSCDPSHMEENVIADEMDSCFEVLKNMGPACDLHDYDEYLQGISYDSATVIKLEVLRKFWRKSLILVTSGLHDVENREDESHSDVDKKGGSASSDNDGGRQEEGSDDHGGGRNSKDGTGNGKNEDMVTRGGNGGSDGRDGDGKDDDQRRGSDEDDDSSSDEDDGEEEEEEEEEDSSSQHSNDPSDFTPGKDRDSSIVGGRQEGSDESHNNQGAGSDWNRAVGYERELNGGNNAEEGDGHSEPGWGRCWDEQDETTSEEEEEEEDDDDDDDSSHYSGDDADINPEVCIGAALRSLGAPGPVESKSTTSPSSFVSAASSLWGLDDCPSISSLNLGGNTSTSGSQHSPRKTPGPSPPRMTPSPYSPRITPGPSSPRMTPGPSSPCHFPFLPLSLGLCLLHDQCISNWCAGCRVYICTECLPKHAVKSCVLRPAAEEFMDQREMVAARVSQKVTGLKQLKTGLKESSVRTDQMITAMEEQLNQLKNKKTIISNLMEEVQESIEEVHYIQNNMLLKRSVGEFQSATKELKNYETDLEEFQRDHNDSLRRMTADEGGLLRSSLSSLVQVSPSPLSLEGLCDKVREVQSTYAVTQINGRTHWGRLTLEGPHLLLHTFQEIQPLLYPKAAIFQYEEVWNKLSEKSMPSAFMDVAWYGKVQGRVNFNLLSKSTRGLQFLKLCTGVVGPSYRNTNLLWNPTFAPDLIFGGDYEHNNGLGGKGIMDLGKEETSRPQPRVHGLVSGVAIDHVSKLAQFIIQAKPGMHAYWATTAFAQVDSGLPIMEAACHNLTPATVVECGIRFNMF